MGTMCPVILLEPPRSLRVSWVSLCGWCEEDDLEQRGRDVELTLHPCPLHEGIALHPGLPGVVDRQELHERQPGLLELVRIGFEDVSARGRLPRCAVLDDQREVLVGV